MYMSRVFIRYCDYFPNSLTGTALSRPARPGWSHEFFLSFFLSMVNCRSLNAEPITLMETEGCPCVCQTFYLSIIASYQGFNGYTFMVRSPFGFWRWMQVQIVTLPLLAASSHFLVCLMYHYYYDVSQDTGHQEGPVHSEVRMNCFPLHNDCSSGLR